MQARSALLPNLPSLHVLLFNASGASFTALAWLGHDGSLFLLLDDCCIHYFTPV